MSLPLFRKPKDPLSRHDRELAAEIERLEKEIAKLSSAKSGPSKPARPAAEPRAAGAASRRPSEPVGLPPAPPPPASPAPVRPAPVAYPAGGRPSRDPGVKEVPLAAHDDHFNAQGLRKFDLAAAWKRWAGWFTSPTPSNPQMIRYLASGSVQGLRPLRYERRVARNRFIGLFLLLFIILWGLLAVYFGRP